MSSAGAPRPARSGPNALVRVVRSWRALSPEQHRSAIAALALWVAMFLPWYSETAVSIGSRSSAASVSLTAWDAFGFVELVLLVITVAVVWLLFLRGEQRGPRVPGGDGATIAAAGGLAAILIFYRMLDRSQLTSARNGLLSTGIEWGIFLAVAAAVWLAYSGVAMRRASRPGAAAADPPSPGIRRQPPREQANVGATRDELPPEGAERRAPTREDAEQLRFELPQDREH
jgi:hypothetical protein